MPGMNYSSSLNFPYGYQGQEKDAATGLTNFELRQYDPRIGRWYNPDPYGQHHSPYLAMSNNPVSFTDPDGGWDGNMGLEKMEGGGDGSNWRPWGNNADDVWRDAHFAYMASTQNAFINGDMDAGMNGQENMALAKNIVNNYKSGHKKGEYWGYYTHATSMLDGNSLPMFHIDDSYKIDDPWAWARKGTLAHSTFTTYMRSTFVGQSEWSFNLSIAGKSNPLRPDIKYDNGVVGGAWEIKPAAPSGSAPKAELEALDYSRQLNIAHGTDRFGPGSLKGAPAPFTGVLNIPSPSGTVFQYTMPNAFNGAIYWSEFTPGQQLPEYRTHPVIDVTPFVAPLLLRQVMKILISPTPGILPGFIPTIPILNDKLNLNSNEGI